jgi:uncharacterized coiled-coil protein SlyX
MDELAQRRTTRERVETLEAAWKLAFTLMENRVTELETTIGQLSAVIAQQTKTMEAMDRTIGTLAERTLEN